MSNYVTLFEGDAYWSPCNECKDNCCYRCLLQKYKEALDKEREKKDAAEFRIKNELEPRIKAEERIYDNYVLSGGSEVAWWDTFEAQVEKLIDMFDDNFDISEFDFDSDDITIKIARLIYENSIEK